MFVPCELQFPPIILLSFTDIPTPESSSMANRKRRRIAVRFLFGVSIVAFVATALALSLWRGIPQKYRSPMMLSSSLAFFLGFTGLSLMAWERKRGKAQTWRRAMSIWKEPTTDSENADTSIPIPLAPEDLDRFVIQLYHRLGYRTFHQECNTNGEKIHWMINPDGEIELIQCIQRDTLIGLREVCDLQERLSVLGAKECTLWAPGGFSQDAVFWTHGKSIQLAGRQDLNRWVKTIYELEGKEEGGN
jgi:hypothetical protein